MSSEAKMGRIIVGRILPGSDLVTGIEEICRKHGVPPSHHHPEP